MKSLRIRKHAENPPELGAINCSVSFRRKDPNCFGFSALFIFPFFFSPSTMSSVLDMSKFLLVVLIQNKDFHKISEFPIGKKS